MSIILCDTSSAIEMRNRRIYQPKGPISVTPMIRDEYQRHRAEIPSSVYAGALTVDSSQNPHFNRFLLAAREKCNEVMPDKKRVRDPVSATDLQLMAEALTRAQEGRSVEVLSEDAHIKGTLNALLKGPYKHLKTRLAVGSVIDMPA